MTADGMLLVVVGLVLGFSAGYAYAWRFARKLERHDVVLSDWDEPYDAQAPAPVFRLDRQRQQ